MLPYVTVVTHPPQIQLKLLHEPFIKDSSLTLCKLRCQVSSRGRLPVRYYQTDLPDSSRVVTVCQTTQNGCPGGEHASVPRILGCDSSLDHRNQILRLTLQECTRRLC